MKKHQIKTGDKLVTTLEGKVRKWRPRADKNRRPIGYALGPVDDRGIVPVHITRSLITNIQADEGQP